MCDIILAAPTSTSLAQMLFGKNSDRQRNEAQLVEIVDGLNHPQGAALDCTYITIPQVRRTYTVLICRPFWMWGAEMGANEHGVVIGNEGLHARTPAPRSDGLTGMDLLRLALERSRTAEEALQIIVSLLERYGQGGNCGHRTPDYYNNGFMVADATKAFVLETIGKEWLVEEVANVRSMSNVYSIGENPSRCSNGLPQLMSALGTSERGVIHYATAISDPNREHLGNAGARRACTTAMLQAGAGKLEAADMMRILRSHGSNDRYQPTLPDRTVCMHASSGTRTGQTVGSMISDLRVDNSVHWVTATSAPCLSIFKPLFLDTPLPIPQYRVTDRFDAGGLWWQHERLHRRVVTGDFIGFLEDIGEERDAMEAKFIDWIEAGRGASKLERTQIVNKCWNEALEMETRWHHRATRHAKSADLEHMRSWNEMNELAGLQDLEREGASVDATAALAIKQERL